MNDIAWNTIAGTVLASSEIEPYFPPTDLEKRRLHNHTFAIGLPVERWEEWASRAGVEKVSAIASYDALYGLWLEMARWQVEHGIDEVPTCPIGASIFQQVKKTMGIILTPKLAAIG